MRGLVFFLYLFTILLSAQLFGNDLPPGFVLREAYAWPVKGYSQITGTFGEFRTGHFHMGQDFSTGGRIGIPILAVADGKVTRVQRKWNSIGYAVFVQHDDGITSRYGHLHKFAPKIIKQILKSKQARRFKDRVDFDIVLPEAIDVKKSEMIALSGDTGVGPPHLHLELFKDNVYYNPVHFGLGYREAEEIIFEALRLTPETSRTFINGKNEPLDIPFVHSGNNRYYLNDSQTILIQGKVGIQVSIHQRSNNSRLGIRSLNLSFDNQTLQGFDLSRILKDHSRKNVLLYDTRLSRPDGNPFSYFLHAKDGNDLLGFLRLEREQGLIDSERFKSEDGKEVSIKATGQGNQEAFAYFKIAKDQGDYKHIITKEWIYNVFYDRYTTFKSKDTRVELFFPVNAVYSKAYFEIHAKEEIKIKTNGLNQLSSVYEIGPEYKDFNLGYDLYVKVPKTQDINSADLYEVLPDGSVKKIKGSSFSSWGQFFKVRLRKTGMFVVLSDQTPPNIYLHESMVKTIYPREDFALLLKAKDVGSGIMPEGFDITVDGIRGKAEYFPKDGRVEIFEPESLYLPGKHTVLASVRDFAGNWSSTVRYDYEIESPPVQAVEIPIKTETTKELSEKTQKTESPKKENKGPKVSKKKSTRSQTKVTPPTSR
ncbi:peptidase family M23/M37 [Leptospira ryugenii]|uniref:Peptidase family M23/M37 n=1 Tax=Leptospira ryugenii TaxID=1917863 RepID=A0A2P2E387_9LEPT|nr:M23 family metallopeptidase [Leptospira ryugenii]GBF51294.1 peptidase family M23/M37 [Leptospira ryugenii]